MQSFFMLIYTILDIYVFLVIANAIMSWLVAFNILNTRNRVVEMIGNFLDQITEPVLRPIRKLIPNLGGIDISPIVLILVIYFIQLLIRNNILVG